MKKLKLLKRRIGCENSKFWAFFDDVQAEDGEVIHDYFVAVPKNKNKKFLTGVAVLPVVDGKIGLLYLYRHPLENFSWEVPRGFIDQGETENLSAARELEEETGLICASKNLRPLGIMSPDAGTYSAKVALFVALSCRRKNKFRPAEMGHRRFKFFTPAQIEKMIAQSEIEDAATLIAYYRFKTKSA